MHQGLPLQVAGLSRGFGPGMRVRGARPATILALGLAGLAGLGACTGAPLPVASTPSTVAASTRAPSVSRAGPDFDGDGGADLVVGIGESPGKVSVRYANGKALDFGRLDVDSTEPDSVDFGQALLARDLNGDGFTDLVVSDPGLGPSLYWIYGSAAGLDLAGRVVTPTDAFPGGGRALALVTQPKPVLVVSGGSGGGTGVVLGYPLGADGRPAAEPMLWTAETLGLPAISAGSRFGSALAATGSLLAIGAPGAAVNDATQAGAVYVIDFSVDPLRGRRITQDSPGVPDNPQTGDRFGAALAAGDDYLVVGVPGEDRLDESGVNRARTGMVQVFHIVDGELRAGVAIDQKDLPGKVEADDLFGSALAMVRPCAGTSGVLIGAPAEAIGAVAQAGSVWVVPFSPKPACSAIQLTGGAGLGTKAEANALIGSAVSVLRTDAQGDMLVVVAQGIYEEGVPGRVLTLESPFTGAPVTVLENLAIREERTIALSPPPG